MDFSGRTVLIAGQGGLARPLTSLLASAGIGSFILFSSQEASDDQGREDLIQAIRARNPQASLHLVQASHLGRQDSLFPQNLDLLVDCCQADDDHLALERACQAQGLPLVLAFASDSLFLTGLVDPYAGSLARIFGEKGLFRPGNSEETCQGTGEEAAQAAAREVLSVLSGQASFSAGQLTVQDRVTCLSSRLPMPTDIPAYPRMVLIGSDHRKLGKTTLCAKLARRLGDRGQPVRVLKIEHQGREGEACLSQESPLEEKPTIRALFEAGCEGVWRLVASENSLKEALTPVLAAIYETMDPRGILLCESNSARRFLQPGFFIQLKSPDGQIKASAVRTTRLADCSLESPFTDDQVARLVESIPE